MALVGERVRCVIRVRPVGNDERAGERSCVQVNGNELVVLPVVGQDGDGAAGPREQSPARVRPGAQSSGEPPRTPTSARGRAPSTPQPRTPLARTPSCGGADGGSFRAPPLNGSVAKAYGFDAVLPPTATQEDVWAECAPFVEAPLDGLNACIFTYGQTGSGKTHTMLGTAEEPGVVRRACARLFAAADARPEAEFQLSVTYVELYNNEFKDLLAPDNQPDRRRALPIELEAARKRRPIALHELPTAAGQPPSVYLSGSETLRTPVRSADELLELVAFGAAARATASTKLNAFSSRSHAILTLHVEARDAGAPTARVGKVHLVDLAGSENLTLSGAEGGTRVEAQAINASLSALADVLEALSKRGAHPTAPGVPNSPRREGGTPAAARAAVGGVASIPYRNHKLTRLLADSIGGNSKTLMLTTVLPFASCHRQTTMAAHFAARARAIRPYAPLAPPAEHIGARALAALTSELEMLRSRLAQRDEEIRMMEKTSVARDAAHAEASASALRQLEEDKRRAEAALRQQLAEAEHGRSVESAEARHCEAAAALELAASRARENARAREACEQLELIEELQGAVVEQQLALQACDEELAQLRSRGDAVRQQLEEDGATFCEILDSWQADATLLHAATERAAKAEAEASALRELVAASAEAQRDANSSAAAQIAHAKERADRSAAKAVSAAQAAAAAAAAKDASATAAITAVRSELEMTRAELASATAALGAAAKRAASDEPTKGQKKQLAELSVEVTKARAEAKTARAAAHAAERDAADARDARDGRLAAEGTLRRRVALLEARLRQGQAGFAELSACVAEARALPALQARLRGLVATTRLLTAPLPAVDSVALGTATSLAAHGGDERERAPVLPAQPPSPRTEPPRAAQLEPPAASESQSAGVSALLGIGGAEQDARVVQTLDALKHGTLARGAVAKGTLAGKEPRARSSKRSNRTKAMGRGESCGDDDDDDVASGGRDAPGSVDSREERMPRARALGVQPDEPVASSPPVDASLEPAASGRPSRRAAKRTYTPEAHADESDGDDGAQRKKRAPAPGAGRARAGRAKRDELVTQQALVTVSGSRNKRQVALDGKEAACPSELRVAPDKENGARDEEVLEASKRRALFNPRRRASHAFSAMV